MMFGKPNQAVEKARLEQELMEAEAKIDRLEEENRPKTVWKKETKGRTKKDISRRRMANSSRRRNRK
jgi:hypothetical protein